MEIVAQLVRAPDCGSGGRGFETRLSPQVLKVDENRPFFMSDFYNYQLDLEVQEGKGIKLTSEDIDNLWK